MDLIFDELPKAIRWSKIFAIFQLIATIFLALAMIVSFTNNPVGGIIDLLIFLLSAWLWWMLREYKVACQTALDSQDMDDLELAVRKQVTIIKFFGFFSLLVLIVVVASFVLGFSAAMFR